MPKPSQESVLLDVKVNTQWDIFFLERERERERERETERERESIYHINLKT